MPHTLESSCGAGIPAEKAVSTAAGLHCLAILLLLLPLVQPFIQLCRQQAQKSLQFRYCWPPAVMQ
jgi:hypothetical protein